MQIHRIRGRDLKDALHRAARLHGEGAVVVAQERDGSGVTLTVSDGRGGHAALERLGLAPRAKEAPRATEEPPRAAAGVAEVRRRLRRRGCGVEWTEAVCRELEKGGGGPGHAIDRAARLVGASIGIARAPRRGGILALVGPTGAGKTTTIAKLAGRLARAGRRVRLATLDGFRLGAVDQLRAAAERLEVPFAAPGDPRELARFAAADGGGDVLLLDTTGRSPADAAALADTAGALAALAKRSVLTPYLVLSASASREASQAALRAYAGAGPRGAVVTKLDETDAPGAALDVVRASGLPLAFLCDGQDLGAHLHRPGADPVADLCLRGRLA